MTANRDDLDRRDALKLIAGGLGLAAVLVACAARGAAARAIPQDPPARDLQAVPNELYLADSSLHIINVYKIEAAVLRDSQGRSQAEILDRLAHEFTHMAGASAAARRDADSGTVLAGIISEGVASYATYVYAAGRLARAQSIGYTEPEWTWALAHEGDLIAAAKPYLGSRVKADDDRLRARNQRLLVGGPTAVAYFLGFRIIEAYAAHHGAASWIDAMDLPAREVLARSGYRF